MSVVETLQLRGRPKLWSPTSLLRSLVLAYICRNSHKAEIGEYMLKCQRHAGDLVMYSVYTEC